MKTVAYFNFLKINFTAENIGAELKAPLLKQEPLQVRGKYVFYSIFYYNGVLN